MCWVCFLFWVTVGNFLGRGTNYILYERKTKNTMSIYLITSRVTNLHNKNDSRCRDVRSIVIWLMESTVLKPYQSKKFVRIFGVSQIVFPTVSWSTKDTNFIEIFID